ncbi:MAG: bifunctional sugar-1-phosphate nucleotidylyltransferase/acetyltransferase [Candidatus Asgardarchaeia archaeon]
MLAAGEGKRLRPFTYTRPKVLIPIAGKPIIEHTIINLRESGIRDIIIVVHYLKEKITEYLGDGTKFGVSITYVEQPDLLGTGDALLYVEKYLHGSDFLMLYGDLLTHKDNITCLLSEYKKTNATAIVAGIKVEDVSQFAAIITYDGKKISKIIEKPVKGSMNSNIANAGIYIFNDQIFDHLKSTSISERGEVELPDAIQRMINDGKTVNLIELKKWWIDIGRPWDILEANKIILKRKSHKIDGFVERGATLHGPVIIEKGAIIRSGVYIIGPALIMKNADIGPNTFIRPYTTIGENSRIGNACEIKNSVLFDNVHIAHLSYVGDSVIGSNVNFGAGTITANLRLDDKTIKMTIKGQRIDTRRRKLGAFIGDNVKTGINAMLMPGVIIGNNSAIGPGVVIYKDVPPNTLVLKKEDIVLKEWKLL